VGSSPGGPPAGDRRPPLAVRLTGKDFRTLAGAGLLLELCFLSLYSVPAGPASVAAFIVIHVLCFALLAFLALKYRRAILGDNAAGGNAAAGTRLAWAIVAFGLLFRLSLVPHSVVCSDDIYRYFWDGKVLDHGINPYAWAPADPQLAPLASTDLPARVNHPTIGSIYPPFAQAFFWLSFRLFGESASGLKLLLTGADLLTMVLLMALLRALKKPAVLVILYAWSPLPVLYGSLDGHVDLAGIPFLLLALLWGERKRPFAAALGVACAALIKLHPLVIAPFLWRVRRGWQGAVAILLAAGLFAAAYLPFRDAARSAMSWLSIYGSRWEFNGGLFYAAYLVLGSNQSAHTAMNIMLGLWLALIMIRKAGWIESVFLVFLGLVIFGPVVHPWYLLWLSALLVVRWSRAVFFFMGLSVVSNVVVWRYIATGAWVDDPLLLAVQYIPFFAVLALDAWTARRASLTRFS
jgi:hypothetical protein